MDLFVPVSCESDTQPAFRTEVKQMYQAQTKSQSCTADEELVDVLTAISVVSMRLARKLTLLSTQSQSTEGGKSDQGRSVVMCRLG